MVLTVNYTPHVLCHCNTCGQGDNGTCVSDYMCNVRLGKNGLVQDCVEKSQVTRIRIWCENTLMVNTVCCNTTLCNTASLMGPPTEAVENSSWPKGWVLVPLFIVITTMAVALILRRKISSRCMTRMSNGCCLKSDDRQGLEDSTDSCSGSGRGATQLARRTIAKDIQCLEIVGKGRCATVYRCLMHESEVALKVFTAKDGLTSWTQEKHIYTQVPLKHENVLAFMVADLESCTSYTRYLIVTHYHPHGSLYDYLRSRSFVQLDAAIYMLRTAASGLHYLHTEVAGRPHKVPLAHRDIKTKNILVKADGACCISDFGLAITSDDLNKIHEHLDGNTNDPNWVKVGTKRYLAPEILDKTIRDSLTSFQSADIYSFGLAIWEVLANCGSVLDGRVSPHVTNTCRKEEHDKMQCPEKFYYTPYAEIVSPNPTFQQMAQIVSKQKMRPQIKFLNRPALGSEVQRPLYQLITNCWCPQPTARVTSLRVCKRLNEVCQLTANQIDKETFM